MIDQPVIADAPLPPVLDWAALVAEGHALLGAMTDGRWTDFNAHDPGVTILEAFAFALTDLGYRAGHPVADLVAGAGATPGRAALLAGRAVTRADRRRVARGAAGVGEAWVEPADTPALHLRHVADPPALFRAAAGEEEERGVAVTLVGVERVVIDKASRDDLPAAELIRGVGAALHAERGLGEDIAEVAVLAAMPVAVAAEIEIVDPSRADTVLLAAYAALAALFARAPVSETAAATSPPEAPARPVALRLSDTIAALSAVEGVRAVRRVRLGVGDRPGAAPRWSLAIPPDRVPRFDPRGSRIRLVAGGGFALDSATREDLVAAHGARDQASTGITGGADLPIASGRDRALAAYRPLRLDLPAIYGVAPGTLPIDAGPARHAQAAQLRAYLALFDALLASQFAQLGAVATLLGPAPVPSHAALLPDPDTGDEPPIHADGFDAAAMQALVEPPGDPAGTARRSRLLAHLLARHGEETPVALPPPGVDGGAGPAARVLEGRTRFLDDVVRLTAARGAGADLLDPDDEPALLDRIRLKAGLTAAEAAGMRLVEHILLRPTDEDDCAQALLTEVEGPDPFSLQLTLVLDDRLRPAGLEAGEVPLLRVARAETPAHLVLHVLWLDAEGFETFDDAYRRWRHAVATARRGSLGLVAA